MSKTDASKPKKENRIGGKDVIAVGGISENMRKEKEVNVGDRVDPIEQIKTSKVMKPLHDGAAAT